MPTVKAKETANMYQGFACMQSFSGGFGEQLGIGDDIVKKWASSNILCNGSRVQSYNSKKYESTLCSDFSYNRKFWADVVNDKNILKVRTMTNTTNGTNLCPLSEMTVNGTKVGEKGVDTTTYKGETKSWYKGNVNKPFTAAGW